MGLVRIHDLNGPPEHVREMVEKAKNLSLLYDQYCNAADHDAHERAAGIHASELSPCLRKVVYNLAGYKPRPVISKFWRQRFMHGHAIHGWLQDDFHKIAARSKAAKLAAKMALDRGWTLDFSDEVRVSPDLQPIAKRLNIHSSCDGIFTFRDETGVEVLRVALEIKSESPDGFDKLKEPKKEHVEQAHVYMACHDVPLTWFFYFSKGSQNNTPSSAPWLVVFDPAIWQSIEDKCAQVMAHAEQGTLPERTETIVCEFCPYTHHCQPQIINSFKKQPAVEAGIRIPGGNRGG